MIYLLKRIPQGTMLYYGDKERSVEMDIIAFLNQWCMMSGSTYEGRKQAACYLLHITQKAPILISSKSKDVLFPIRGVRDKDCIFLNHRAIYQVRRDQQGSAIHFVNDTVMYMDIDIRVLKRGMLRCDSLLQRIR